MALTRKGRNSGSGASKPREKKVKNYYLSNPLIKKDGIEYEWTPHEIEEYAKCMTDPIYFAEKYVKIINLDGGMVPYEPYPYQKQLYENFETERFNICLFPRQAGKTTAVIIWLLHYTIFNPEKTVAVIANKGHLAREILSRAVLALENLPFFLQPGCKVLNKGSIVFSNNSRMFASSTSSSAVRGFSANIAYIDELGFIPKADAFYTSVYPIISSGKNSKIIITSTPNGVGNLYHRLWEGAIQKTNEYKPLRVYWWDVPGRDEEWKRQTIKNTSEMQFRQEHEGEFLGSGKTLISPANLLKLKAETPIYAKDQIRVFKEPVEDHEYVIVVDVAKGRGQDYSTFTIIDITTTPFEQVATFRDNTISALLFPDHVYKYGNIYNQAYALIESNDSGEVVANSLYYDLEYENIYVQSTVKSNAIGVAMNKKIKRIGCSNIKDLIEEDKFLVKDAETIKEISTFEEKGASYEASDGNNDDLMMNLVLFGWFTTTDHFASLYDKTLKQILFEQQMREIEESVTPFGYIISSGNDATDPNYPEVEVDVFGDVWQVVR